MYVCKESFFLEHLHLLQRCVFWLFSSYFVKEENLTNGSRGVGAHAQQELPSPHSTISGYKSDADSERK